MRLPTVFTALLCAACSLLFAPGGHAQDPATGPQYSKPAALHDVSSSTCGQCHKTIYGQWQGSMHAQASALEDPIHGAFYRNVIGDPTQEGVTDKKGNYPVCLKCHAPNAAMSKRTKLDALPAYNEGVNCVFCHTITAFKGTDRADGKLQLGTDAYEVSPVSLQGSSGRAFTTAPAGDPANPITPLFHPLPMNGSNAALFKSSDVCMGCHDRRNNFHGVPLCATGTEVAESRNFVPCQSCHMPVIDGVSDHSMLGGHNRDMVRKALIMKMDAKTEGDAIQVRVDISNKLPHSFPTGAPFRNAYLKLTAYAEDGTVLWQNYGKHPMEEDPQAMFMYKLGDDEGKPALPPMAKTVIEDSRLKADETRTLNYTVPAAGVKVVRAEVLYNLLLPNIVKKIDKVLTDDLRNPKQAALAELRL